MGGNGIMKRKTRFALVALLVSLLALCFGAAALAATATYTALVPTGSESDEALKAKRVTFNGHEWHIIEDNSEENGAGSVTLLAADGSFGQHHFDDYGNWYMYSDIREYLLSYLEEGKEFYEAAEAMRNDPDPDGWYRGKLYLLSIKEAEKLPFNILKLKNYYDFRWWLCSESEIEDETYDSYAAYVWGQDSCTYLDEFIAYEGGPKISNYVVRPALKLDLEKVVFAPKNQTFLLKSKFITSLSLPSEFYVTAGETDTVTPTVVPSSAKDQALTWAYKDGSIATVDENGVVTANATGTTFITATTNNGTGNKGDDLTATCAVTVLPAHTHDDITFSIWQETDSLPDEAGSYYLVGNVTLDENWFVPTGETNLCLNGHTILSSANGDAIYVKNGCALTLYDCAANPGTIAHVADERGRGVHVMDGGAFAMHGGVLSDHHSSGTGGGVFVEEGGAFTMTEGAIENNVADQGGGGVFAQVGAAVNLSGTPVIRSNTTGEADSNLELQDTMQDGTGDAAVITVTGALQTGAQVGVRLQTLPDGADTRAITSGYGTHNSQDPSAYFTSDDGRVIKLSDSEARVTAEAVTGDRIVAAVSGFAGVYDGEPHGITVSVLTPKTGARILYGTSEDSLTETESPTITDVAESTLTVYYQVTAENYETKTGSATVSILPAAGEIEFAEVTVEKTIADGSFTPDLTHTGDGTITYLSSNPDVATVDAQTGLVTLNEESETVAAFGEGSATIVAQVTEKTDGNYTYETRFTTCILTVKDTEKYPLWIDGRRATPDVHSGEGWSYDAKNTTLTLTDFTYQGAGSQWDSSAAAIRYEGKEELTISLSGTNRVETTGGESVSSAYGVYCRSRLTVTGTGSLEAVAGTATDASAGLVAEGVLTVEEVTLTAAGSDAENLSCGIWAGDALALDRGTVTATAAEGANSAGVAAAGGLSVLDGTLTATGGKATQYDSFGIRVAGGEFALHSGTVTGQGGEAAAENRVSVGVLCVSKPAEIEDGTLNAVGGKAESSVSVGLCCAGNVVTVTGGTVNALGGEGAKSYGISKDPADDTETTEVLSVSEEVAALNAAGETLAVNGLVKSAVAGKGYTEKGIAALIAISEEALDLSDYLTVLFPLELPEFGTADFTLPENLTAIEENAFQAIAATAVEINPGCASIASQAFAGCTALEKVRIPDSIESADDIADDAFEGCGLLYLYGTAGGAAESYCNNHSDSFVFIEDAR